MIGIDTQMMEVNKSHYADSRRESWRGIKKLPQPLILQPWRGSDQDYGPVIRKEFSALDLDRFTHRNVHVK